MKNQTNAFTLIELLIVVAIIGILAMIAVPNFLNAMVRAKIARTQSDFKALYNAIEIYRSEKLDYPAAIIYSGPRMYNFRERYRPLTTPISYINQIPKDPFPHKSRYEFDMSLDLRYEYDGADVYGYFRSDFAGHNGNYNLGGKHWMISSSGPDGMLQYLGYFPPNRQQAEELCSLCRIDVPYVLLEVVEYDPSNGIISSGELCSWGGK